MTKRIVILGGGTGGTLTANRLRRHYSGADVEIVVVDQNDDPRLPAGTALRPLRIDAPRRDRPPSASPAPPGHRVTAEPPIDRVDLDADSVRLVTWHRTRLRRAGRRHRLHPGPRGDRRAHRTGLDGEGLHLLRRPEGAVAPARRPRVRSTGAGWWSTSSTCPSSARWRRWSSASWPTGTSTSRHARPGRAHLRDPARRRLHQAGGVRHAWPGCSTRRASSS